MTMSFLFAVIRTLSQQVSRSTNTDIQATGLMAAGPGINDNGSGTISILEVATQLTKFSVRNAVRFSWWTAEEAGLVGATYYVAQLTAKEKSKIKLVLDYDMMASPNFIYGIYDGDGSAFNNTGPLGSSEAEHEFAAYFDSKGLGHTELEFDGRSDYGPFLDAGIAAGGIAAGAEVLKTPEEAAIFGGEVGIPYDVCYHSACDTVANLNATAWAVMTGAIAHTTAVYAASWETIPSPKKRSVPSVLKGRSMMEAERREKAEAEKRALNWVSGPNARQWLKKHQRV
jgi:Zn-dependent M28 family amino/carboxypeptidase